MACVQGHTAVVVQLLQSNPKVALDEESRTLVYQKNYTDILAILSRYAHHSSQEEDSDEELEEDEEEEESLDDDEESSEEEEEELSENDEDGPIIMTEIPAVPEGPTINSSANNSTTSVNVRHKSNLQPLWRLVASHPRLLSALVCFALGSSLFWIFKRSR